MEWVIIYFLVHVMMSLFAFGLLWHEWYDTFGPHMYGPGNQWSSLSFDEERFKGTYTMWLTVALVCGPFTIGTIIQQIVTRGLKFRFRRM